MYPPTTRCRCVSGPEPKNSGRRVRVALEVELAMKASSAAGGQRVDLPLEDRSASLHCKRKDITESRI